MNKGLLYIAILMLATAGGAAAQDSGGEDEDPFRNDPFFSRPLEDFFRKPSGSESDSSRNNRDEYGDVRHYVKRLTNNGIDYDAFVEAGPYNSSALYSQFPNMPMIHFNRVNGLFLGLKKERMQWYGDDWIFDIRGLHPHGLIGYAFARKELDYSAGLEKTIGRNEYILAGAEFHDATATDDFWRVGLTETTFTSFFAGYDYLDYYRQQGWGAYLLLRTRRLFEGGIAYNDERFTTLPKETEYALFGSGGRYRANPPVDFQEGSAVDTVDIGSVTLSAEFNPKRLVLSRRFTFSLSGLAEFSNSTVYSYEKYVAEMLAFLNFEPGGVLRYRLKVGSITGDAPNMKEFQLGGLGSLRALPYKSMPGGLIDGDHFGNQMILSNAELQFGSPEFGNSDWIDFDDFYLSLFLDSGWVDFSRNLADSSDPFSGFSSFNFAALRHNGGVGLGSSLLRIELAWDLENTEMAPVLWLRLNPTF